jgi:hypothetical protein
MLTQESRRTAGILLVVLPTVIYGGVSLLGFLLDRNSGYMQNPLRQNLFRAGHAHAGVLLVLSLVALRYVDEAELPGGWKWVVRSFIPSAAIFLPAAFFLSVLSPSATQPNAFIYLAFVGAVALAIGLVTLGVGLLRARRMANSS